MKLSLRVLLTVVFALTFTALTAGANNYHYAVRVPAGAQTCQAEAAGLSQRFELGSRARVIEAVCRGTITINADGNTYQLYNLLLTYQADKVVSPYSAVFGTSTFSSIPGDHDGIYNTYAGCLADIPEQTFNFMAATGLQAIDAYCTEVDDLDHMMYKLHIDGVGTKTNSLYVFNPNFSGVADAQLKTEIKNTLATKGAVTIKECGNNFFYYAPYAVDLSNRVLGLYHDARECQSQLADAKAIYVNSGAKNVIERCLVSQTVSSQMTFTTYSLEVVQDASMLSEDFGGRSDYYSFDECMQDKARAIQDAGPTAMGGICVTEIGTKGHYSLDLFSKF